MTYNYITLLSQLVADSPADLDNANELAAAVRQVKQFLGKYLAVSHTDSGTLRSGAIAFADQVGDGVITGDHIGQATITNYNMAGDSVDSVQLVDGSVLTPKIADAAVTTEKLALNAVDTPQIKDASVTAVKLAAGAVTATTIGDNTITSDKISGDGTSSTLASKISAGSITAVKLASDPLMSGTDILLPVIKSTGNVMAKIGGALSATITPATTTIPAILNFALSQTLVTDSERLALFQQKTPNPLYPYHRYQQWSKILGNDTFAKVTGTYKEEISIYRTGMYLVVAYGLCLSNTSTAQISFCDAYDPASSAWPENELIRGNWTGTGLSMAMGMVVVGVANAEAPKKYNLANICDGSNAVSGVIPSPDTEHRVFAQIMILAL